MFDQIWGYLFKQGIAPVYVGEFGTKLHRPQGRAVARRRSPPTWRAISTTTARRDIAAGDKGVSWTFWSWNPNSGDTGGILRRRLEHG